MFTTVKDFHLFRKTVQFDAMIAREHYISKIRPFFESNLIKIITGIRRCGKSVLMDQIEEELKSQGRRTLKLNFERRDVSSRIAKADDLVAEVQKHTGKDKLFVFLDEVQMVDQWHLACRSLRLENVSLFITGSNSKLLSSEFAKELSGRYVAFQVRPFVYKELTEYAAELGRSYSLGEYLIFGGFPQILELNSKDAVLAYLNDLDETIVINDILSRYSIKKTAIFRRLVNFLLLSNARVFSARAVLRALKSEGLDCSINTILKYVDYLEEAYVVSTVRLFSTKAKRELKYTQKIYNADVGLNSIRQTNGRWDITHNLENVVFNELLYRGYELSVFRKDDLEIDFLAEKPNRQYLIQVAYSVADEKAYDREFALFNRLDQSRAKILITNDDVDYSTSTVRHIRLKDFLLMDDFL